MSNKSRRTKNRRRNLPDLKVVMVGDACVGKTSLVKRYMEREYQETTSTIGAAFALKTWGLNEVAIWDTAGEEKYAGMTTYYYRGASAAILTFDMFDRASFYNLNERYIPILNNVTDAKLKVIVATKSDLLGTQTRMISREQGIELAKKSNPYVRFDDEDDLPYFETSAKTGHNVDEAFEYTLEFFFLKNEFAHQEGVRDSIHLEDSPRTRNFHCCH